MINPGYPQYNLMGQLPVSNYNMPYPYAAGSMVGAQVPMEGYYGAGVMTPTAAYPEMAYSAGYQNPLPAAYQPYAGYQPMVAPAFPEPVMPAEPVVTQHVTSQIQRSVVDKNVVVPQPPANMTYNEIHEHPVTVPGPVHREVVRSYNPRVVTIPQNPDVQYVPETYKRPVTIQPPPQVHTVYDVQEKRISIPVPPEIQMKREVIEEPATIIDVPRPMPRPEMVPPVQYPAPANYPAYPANVPPAPFLQRPIQTTPVAVAKEPLALSASREGFFASGSL